MPNARSTTADQATFIDSAAAAPSTAAPSPAALPSPAAMPNPAIPTAAAPNPALRPAASPSSTPQPRGVHRRATFGLRWGRGRPQHSAQAPSEPPALTALLQPAVPFTVALPTPEHDAAADGMTPWRAVAARASQHGQQSAPVAEAASAEQETSA